MSEIERGKGYSRSGHDCRMPFAAPLPKALGQTDYAMSWNGSETKPLPVHGNT